MPHYKYEKWARANLDVVWDASPPELYARCPFTKNHRRGDQTPSFGINVQKGVYHCHGCGENGSFQQLAIHLRVGLVKTHASPQETIDSVRSMRKKSVETEQVKIYPEEWLGKFNVSVRVRKYWIRQRGLSPETVEEWGLGYELTTNSAIIPLRDFHGRILGVIRRRLDDDASPRYIYPKGFKISQHLWGSWFAKGEETVAICEGSVDALACWDAHIPAVALLGSRISNHQVTLLRRLGCRNVILMLDRDEAGIQAARQVRQSVKGMLVYMGTYRHNWPGKDPADLSFRQRRTMAREATLLSGPGK